MTIQPAGRQVLVFGASSDIGLQTCWRFAQAGHRVIAQYRTSDRSLRALPLNAKSLRTARLDLADLAAVREFASSPPAVDSDAVVFLAAAAKESNFENFDSEAVEYALRVGALSTHLVMSVVGPAMADRHWGRFVVASSIGVKFGGGQDSFAYALANHASEFIPSSVRNWAAMNVLTNVVRIGVTRTRLHASFGARNWEDRVRLIPAKRMALPEEIAEAIFWLGSDLNTFMTGQVLSLSGGE